MKQYYVIKLVRDKKSYRIRQATLYSPVDNESFKVNEIELRSYLMDSEVRVMNAYLVKKNNEFYAELTNYKGYNHCVARSTDKNRVIESIATVVSKLGNYYEIVTDSRAFSPHMFYSEGVTIAGTIGGIKLALKSLYEQEKNRVALTSDLMSKQEYNILNLDTDTTPLEDYLSDKRVKLYYHYLTNTTAFGAIERARDFHIIDILDNMWCDSPEYNNKWGKVWNTPRERVYKLLYNQENLTKRLVQKGDSNYDVQVAFTNEARDVSLAATGVGVVNAIIVAKGVHLNVKVKTPGKTEAVIALVDEHTMNIKWNTVYDAGIYLFIGKTGSTVDVNSTFINNNFEISHCLDPYLRNKRIEILNIALQALGKPFNTIRISNDAKEIPEIYINGMGGHQLEAGLKEMIQSELVMRKSHVGYHRWGTEEVKNKLGNYRYVPKDVMLQYGIGDDSTDTLEKNTQDTSFDNVKTEKFKKVRRTTLLDKLIIGREKVE